MRPEVETWQIHNRITLYLLDALNDDSLGMAAATKGRTVGAQFAHMHNVRRMWLSASAPDLAGSVEKIEDATKKELSKHLAISADAISQLLEKAFETGKVKGFKAHASAFLGYLIAHESHHRGQILMTLKQHGKLPDKKILYGMWEWGVR